MENSRRVPGGIFVESADTRKGEKLQKLLTAKGAKKNRKVRKENLKPQ